MDKVLNPSNQVREKAVKWALYVWMCGGVDVCVVNIVISAVDWPLLLHTLTDHD